MRGDKQGSRGGGAEALRGGVLLRLADQRQGFGVNGEADGLDDAGGLCVSVSGFGSQWGGLRVAVRMGAALPKVPRLQESAMFLLTWPQDCGRDLIKKKRLVSRQLGSGRHKWRLKNDTDQTFAFFFFCGSFSDSDSSLSLLWSSSSSSSSSSSPRSSRSLLLTPSMSLSKDDPDSLSLAPEPSVCFLQGFYGNQQSHR